jgi:hypothetical protein
MNLDCWWLSPLPTSFTCPLRIMFMTRVPLQGAPCRLQGEKAHSWLDQAFDEAVVLLHHVVEVLDLPQFTRGWYGTGGFEQARGPRAWRRFSRP